MNSQNKESNILEFKKSKHLNIGIVIFGIIFIYLIVTIIMYIAAPRVTAYEVRQGSILNDSAYTALALRDEVVVTASDSGYINYYTDNNSKIKVGSPVYTVSTNELNLDEMATENSEPLSKDEINQISSKIQKFNDIFQSNDFDYVYQFKDDIAHSVTAYTSINMLDQLESISNGFMKYSNVDGIIVHEIDGLESVTTDSFTLNHLSKSNYKETTFANDTAVVNGDPIYKVVLSDFWNLVFAIEDDTATALADKSSVTVKFKKDNQQLRVGFEISEKNGSKVMILNFNNSMIRYINERYLDIELVLDNETGLKIPKSAETSKDFYIVPISYLTQGGNSSDDGVLVKSYNKDGESIIEFKEVTVYYEQDDYIYLDPNEFEDGQELLKPDSTETYPLSQIQSLKGVYSINKGYAVFKQIQILCESDDYYIIEEGNDFGLSNYDHIALHAEGISENDVLF